VGADLEHLSRLFGLTDRVALVTGARHGIGAAVALGLARAGARVAVSGRDAAALAPLARELDAIGAEHLELTLDVADPAQAADAVRAAGQRWGRLDVVVNNAGLSIRAPAAELSLEDWDAMLDTNLRGPFVVARAAAVAMTAGGRIVNLSSTYARTAAADRSAYAASKAALEQLTRVLALEWAARGITVNAIAPGATPTETRQAVLGDERTRRERAAGIPLGRLGAPEDVVGAVLLLAGDAGAFITGHTIAVDGGFTLS
jgi:NAD(P)-dependent dehydrogenase (short-subunit alcohol dehydrogenase family)